jgi:Putative peptidoglycan binding domain
MEGRAPTDPELDDWFDEPRPRPSTSAEPAAADDWISSGAEPAPPRGSPVARARALATNWAALAVGLGALALLLIGLAAAGVFSGGGSHTVAPPTTVPTTASTATQAPATAPSAPATTLKPGDKGVQVKALQRALASLGYESGKIDGQYGPGTQKALAAFQKAHGLTADGILGPKTLAALGNALGQTG